MRLSATLYIIRYQMNPLRYLLKILQDTPLEYSTLQQQTFHTITHSIHSTKQRATIPWNGHSILLQCILDIPRPSIPHRPTRTGHVWSGHYRHYLHTHCFPLWKFRNVRHIVGGAHTIVEGTCPSTAIHFGNVELIRFNCRSDWCNATSGSKEEYILRRKVVFEPL